jgi:hypothetical protein
MRTHRFGRKIKLPATIAIKHEIRMRMVQYETKKAEDEARAEGRQDGMANCTDRSGGRRQSFARRKSNMNNITTEELVLLSGLFLSKRTISGNEGRDGMKRLVDEGYATEQSITIDSVMYTITDRGRAHLAACGE